MEVVHGRCAALDISKKDAKVCVRIAGAGRRKTVTTWGSLTSQILALRDHLAAQELADLEDDLAVAQSRAEQATGTLRTVPNREVRQRLGMTEA